jgi:hypothetical protein
MNTHPFIAEQLIEDRQRERLVRADRSRLVAEARRPARKAAREPRAHGGGVGAARPVTP